MEPINTDQGLTAEDRERYGNELFRLSEESWEKLCRQAQGILRADTGLDTFGATMWGERFNYQEGVLYWNDDTASYEQCEDITSDPDTWQLLDEDTAELVKEFWEAFGWWCEMFSPQGRGGRTIVTREEITEG